ncbi:hypothetical protein SAMN03159496_03872 [Rhizobium sp. NFR07]|uniref:hypothetical protein n=1 Tax=Rhizobium sp. NFR07 TaxID=1566262 RepID=UPI0008E5513D|nr:hypothetical protein [Rhizobium sp. NFR07]SFB45635.1 hypothetical protein SAMN03159496_03872 [Rhizobium sp. NFR07]
MRIICVSGLALMASLLSGSLAHAIERPATKAEIERIAVGHTINGRMRYMENGRYVHAGKYPGVYRISDGRICIHFDSRRNRCDRIVTEDNGKTFWMITSAGKRTTYRRRP